MSLPTSFLRDGFQPAAQARVRMKLPNGRFLKPLLIGTEGETNTGKSEFILSCPGPGIFIALDRGFDGLLDNPNPPKERKSDQFAFKVIKVPLNTGPTAKGMYEDYFRETRSTFYKALDNTDAVTVAIDGDSDFWELQRLAEFGKLANVWPQTKYGDVYAGRRAMTARAWDSGKIVIGTNKIRDEYLTVTDSAGQPMKERDGSDTKRKTGNKVRQGFPDQDYLWQIQLRHFYNPPRINGITHKEVPGTFGIRLLKCKHNRSLEGMELIGDDCNFRGLVSAIYPEVDMKEWSL